MALLLCGGAEITSLQPLHLSAPLLDDDMESPEYHLTQQILWPEHGVGSNLSTSNEPQGPAKARQILPLSFVRRRKWGGGKMWWLCQIAHGGCTIGVVGRGDLGGLSQVLLSLSTGLGYLHTHQICPLDELGGLLQVQRGECECGRLVGCEPCGWITAGVTFPVSVNFIQNTKIRRWIFAWHNLHLKQESNTVWQEIVVLTPLDASVL